MGAIKWYSWLPKETFVHIGDQYIEDGTSTFSEHDETKMPAAINAHA